MITGSGPQDRNESLAGHQPFRVIADRLARAGIGSYRYDDRGVGASVGDFSAATSHDFAIDAIAALKALRARGITQVGYLGHSEGGLVGPLAQLEQPGDFLVLLAPPGVPGAAIAQEQAVRIAEAAGVKPDELEQIRRTNAAVFAVLERKGSHAELKQALSVLPADTAGNRVNWVRAIEEGAINPRTNLFPQTEVRLLDQDSIISKFGSMPAVKFPHRQHTLWLDCTNCHDRLFKAQAGANRYSMTAILNGEQCGVCHGAVAFPLTECNRCHSVPNASLGRRAAAPAPTAPIAPIAPTASTASAAAAVAAPGAPR